MFGRHDLFVLAAVCSIVSASSAQAQAPPPPPACPNGEDKLLTYTPGYGQLAKSAVYRIELDEDEYDTEVITNVVVTVDRDGGDPSATPVELRGPSTKIILVAPSQGARFTVTFDWDQDAGTAAACHGRDAYVLPLLPARADVGDPFAPRLDGRFRIRGEPYNYRGRRFHVVWTLQPTCDFFACSTRLRPTFGLRGSFQPRADSEYRLVRKNGIGGTCTVESTPRNDATGQFLRRQTETIHRAYHREQRVDLRVLGTSKGAALTITGKITYTYRPTARARGKHCTHVVRYQDRITGRRL